MSGVAINNLIEKIDQDGSGLRGYKNTIQFEFTDVGETYNVQFLEDKAVVVDEVERAACVVQITSENFEKLVAGELNPQTAFFFGKIKAKGDLSQLLKLSSILDYYQK
ncbi:SCP2 sterol-binding domain-containing protein [Ureibacillus manganicus]|uniref:Sterol carrier protein n=1 Tax=Ureibacillus manganicus DSM 26584 TaxID=1384049 RepID=A0A0A3I0T3_9BACL|nr:SCP2 sterol-binding domain-containing protein [Ureibacillus manganicus]KGR78294.1 sterol carrier protein [Ureibacillus manganicus DSM 26584]